MDKIHIRDIAVDCIIGVNPDERVRKQKVLINLELTCDLSPGTHTDRIGDTLDYTALNDRVIRTAAEGDFGLIEAMAEAMAADCLRFDRVSHVVVTVDKPGALHDGRSVAVTLSRAR